MVQSLRPRLTAAHKTELWRRWRRGESLNAIGRALGRIAKVVRYEVARTGGIPPAARQRARLALTLPEREAISRGLASGTSVRQISRQLRRAPSTVSREVRRHGGRRRDRAATADAAAWARGRRPKRLRAPRPLGRGGAPALGRHREGPRRPRSVVLCDQLVVELSATGREERVAVPDRGPVAQLVGTRAVSSSNHSKPGYLLHTNCGRRARADEAPAYCWRVGQTTAAVPCSGLSRK